MAGGGGSCGGVEGRGGSRHDRAAASPCSARAPQFGMGKAKGVARKQRKERKNRAKKLRGVKKSKGK